MMQTMLYVSLVSEFSDQPLAAAAAAASLDIQTLSFTKKHLPVVFYNPGAAWKKEEEKCPSETKIRARVSRMRRMRRMS